MSGASPSPSEVANVEGRSGVSVQKPKALIAGSRLAAFAPASPGEDAAAERGCAELARLGFTVERRGKHVSEGYFAASAASRRADFLQSLRNPRIDGLIAMRGGYGSNYLLDDRLDKEIAAPKCLIGFSDLTSLQIYLWQRCRWTSIYGPMLGAGLEAGAGLAKGYDEPTFLNAIGNVGGQWGISLQGEILAQGESEGTMLGGCMTLVETSIGTPWELDTRDSILLLEDRGMKPWQVDRALMHLQQAGKFAGVRGLVLGDFPDCPAPITGSPSVQDVCDRILKPLGIPIVFGAPVGHTVRPLLTIPLGVRARLHAAGAGSLDILEAAVTA
jgi:muramoyltetrapeptide carboxypeptidase